MAPKASSLADLVVFDADGALVALPQLWRDGPVLLFFMRHFGCAVCRAELAGLQKQEEAIRAVGGSLVAIAPESASMTKRYAQTHNFQFPIFSDRERHVYNAFGLGDGRLKDVLSVDVLLRVTRETLKGNRTSLDAQGASAMLLGGTFIVDRLGQIRFSHIAQPIYNYPPLGTYLSVFRQLGGRIPSALPQA